MCLSHSHSKTKCLIQITQLLSCKHRVQIQFPLIPLSMPLSAHRIAAVDQKACGAGLTAQELFAASSCPSVKYCVIQGYVKAII